MNNEAEDVLWWRGSEPLVDSEINENIDVEVAVVGGGYTGLSTALHLAEQGRSVTVLEAQKFGFGGSGRNAAGVLGIWPVHAPDQLTAKVGSKNAARMNELVASSVPFLRDLLTKHKISADLRLDGIWLAAHNRSAEAALPELARQWTTFGNPMAIVEGRALQDQLRTERYRRAVLIEQAGTIDPGAYVRGLATASAAAGARLHQSTRVVSLEENAHGWQLTCGNGAKVRAHWVIIATNAYSLPPIIGANLARSYYRMPVAVVASKPMTELIDLLPRIRRPLGDTNSKNLFWFCITNDSRLIVSLLPLRSDTPKIETLGKVVMNKLRRAYRALPEIEWDTNWIGHVAMRPDRMPKCLLLGRRAVAPLGYAGQGIATATAVGKSIADAIVADDIGRTVLPLSPPDRLPLARVLPSLIRRTAFPLSRFADRFY